VAVLCQRGPLLSEKRGDWHRNAFCVAKKDAFYLWSFKNSGFVELDNIPIPQNLYWMKKRYTDLKHYQRFSNRPPYADPEDYFCPFMYQ